MLFGALDGRCGSSIHAHRLWFSVDHRLDLLCAKFGGCTPPGSTTSEPPPEASDTVMGALRIPYIGWSKNDGLLFDRALEVAPTAPPCSAELALVKNIECSCFWE